MRGTGRAFARRGFVAWRQRSGLGEEATIDTTHEPNSRATAAPVVESRDRGPAAPSAPPAPTGNDQRLSPDLSGGNQRPAADPPPAARLGALRHRDFRLLWAGSLISNVGTWMHVVAQGWLMYQLTDSPLALGLVGLMRAIPLLAFPLWGGVVADRVSRVQVLWVTQLAALALAAGLGILTTLSLVQPWHILVYAFVGAAVLAFDTPARQALLPDLVGPDDLVSAISLNSWAFSGATLIGPALAAALLPVIGIGGVFLVNALTFAAVLVALALLRVRRDAAIGGSARQNLVDGLTYLRAQPTLLTLVLLTAVLSLLGRSYGQLMPVFARDFLSLDASGMSVLFAAAGLGTFTGLAGLVAAGDPRPKGLLAYGSGLVFAVALGLFAVSRSTWLSVGLLFVVGLSLIVFSTMVSALLQGGAPGPLRGRVMSVYTLCWQGLEYVGVLFTGALATAFGAPAVVVAMATLIVGVFLCAGLARRPAWRAGPAA